VFVARLRHKIERDPGNPRLLITEQGIGYRIAAR
jgi:DNA-binding response OmpR family regulator